MYRVLAVLLLVVTLSSCNGMGNSSSTHTPPSNNPTYPNLAGYWDFQFASTTAGTSYEFETQIPDTTSTPTFKGNGYFGDYENNTLYAGSRCMDGGFTVASTQSSGNVDANGNVSMTVTLSVNNLTEQFTVSGVLKNGNIRGTWSSSGSCTDSGTVVAQSTSANNLTLAAGFSGSIGNQPWNTGQLRFNGISNLSSDGFDYTLNFTFTQNGVATSLPCPGSGYGLGFACSTNPQTIDNTCILAAWGIYDPTAKQVLLLYQYDFPPGVSGSACDGKTYSAILH